MKTSREAGKSIFCVDLVSGSFVRSRRVWVGGCYLNQVSVGASQLAREWGSPCYLPNHLHWS